MDRTIIAPWKAEEKELSEKLYKKLQGLALLFPPSTELRKCLTEDMFLKPNQHAFFHVMHFFFRAHDAVEFKKRFYWPITDKRSEALFRSTTVEYLKHLSEKHNLQWTIKSYLVVMPGGIKFINFLLDLTSFVVRELTQQRERILVGEVEAGQVIDWNLKRLRMQNQVLKQFAAKFIQDLDVVIAKHTEKIAELNKELENMAIATGISVSILTSNSFQTEFEADNKRCYEEKFKKRSTELMQLNEPLLMLKETMDVCQAKDTHTSKYNKDAVRQALREVSTLFPIQTSSNTENDIKMQTLIDAFNCIQPGLVESLATVDKVDCNSEFIGSQLSSFRSEFHELEQQIMDFQKTLNASNHKKLTDASMRLPLTPLRGAALLSEGSDSAVSKALLTKYVSTPPIKLEMLGSGCGVNARLPLLDEQHMRSKEAYESFLVAPRSARKPIKHALADQSMKDLNSTMNKSKIIDPMQLLRTLQRSSSKPKPPIISCQQQQQQQRSLALLGSKWREREALFDQQQNTTALAAAAIGLSEKPINFTPLNLDKTACNSNTQCLESSSVVGVYTKKLSAVKKVQSDSMNFHNLSTSPSGRLEPLVHIEPANLQNVPKIQLNNDTLQVSS